MGNPSRSRTVVGRLLLPCALGLVLAVAASLWLDRSAGRAGQVGRVRLWARVVAQVAAAPPTGLPHGGGADSCVAPLLAALVATDPDVASVRVEAADGRVLGQAGDAARAEAWEDRTFALASGPVRVRLGYRLEAQPLALAVRAALWALLVGLVLAVVLGIVGWSLRQ